MKSSTALFITNRTDRRYFSGVDGGEGYLIVGKEKAYFTDKRYFLALKEKLASSDIAVFPFYSDEDIKEYLNKKGIKTLYIDYSSATVEEYKRYKTFGVSLRNAKKKIDSLRSKKSAKEISYIKKACEIIETAFYRVLPLIKEGITENELKFFLEHECAALGAEGTSFDTIVAFGKNSAVPHHETGNAKLERNSPVLIDAGVFYRGYASDFTRTVYFGTPTKEFILAYDTVLKANETAEEKITAGMSTKEADGIARDIIEKAGYKDNFTHSLGHGVGLEIHEFPYLSQKSKAILKNGNVFTVEPGVYFDYKFGIRIEDTVVLKNGKVKRFFTDDKKLIIIK